MRWVQLFLLCLAFALVEALIGGTRLLFSLPSGAVLALMALLSPFPWRHPDRPAHAGCLMATGVFAGLIFLRAWFSPVAYLARTDLCLLLGALLVYLLTAVVLTRSRQRLVFVAALLLLAVIQASLGAWQHFRAEHVVLFGGIEPEDYGLRASGTYISPNHLAGFLEVTLLLGLGIACWSRRSAVPRVLAAFGVVASAFGLALTGSRGGYLSAAVGLAVFAGLSLFVIRRGGAGRGWAAGLVALALVAALTGGFAIVILHERALQVRASRLITQDQARFDLWRAAWQQAQLRPLTGTGSGTYQYYARHFRPRQMQADPVHAHNDYLELLAEYGALGFAAGLAFLGTHLWRGVRVLLQGLREDFRAFAIPQGDRLALTLAAIAAVAAYAAHSLVDFNLHIPANAMLMGFIFGLLANPGELTETASVGDERATIGARIALPAAAVWIAIVALPTFPAEFHAEPARRALRAEHYGQAIASVQAGLEWDEKNPFLWLHLGQAHASLAEANTNAAQAGEFWQAAAQAFERGLKLYPHEQWLMLGMGGALDGLRRYKEADAIYQRATEWNPTSAVVRYQHGAHLLLAGRFDEAEAEFKKSLECWFNPAALHGMERLAEARKGQAGRGVR